MATDKKSGVEARPSLREIALRDRCLDGTALDSATKVRREVTLAGYRNKSSGTDAVDIWQAENPLAKTKKKGDPMSTLRSFVAILCIGIAFSTGCGHKTGKNKPVEKQAREFSSQYDGTQWLYQLEVIEGAFTNEPEMGEKEDKTKFEIMPRKTVVTKVKDLATSTVTEYAMEGKDKNGAILYTTAPIVLPAEFQYGFFDRGFTANMSDSAYYVEDPDGFTLKGQATNGTIRPYAKMSIPGLPGRGVDKKVRNDRGSFQLYLNVEGLEGELQMPKLTDIGSSPFPISDSDGDGYVLAEDANLPDNTYYTTVWVTKNGEVTGRMDVAGSAYAYNHAKFGWVIGFVKEGGSIRPIFDASVKQADSVLIPGPEVVVQFPKVKKIPFTFSGKWSNGFWQDLTFVSTPYVVDTPQGNATVEVGDGFWTVKKVDGKGEDVIASRGWDSLPAKSVTLKITPNLEKIEFTERSYQLFNSTPAVTKESKVRKTFVNGFSDESKAGVKFRMEDERVATVDDNGAITPVGLGETKMDCYIEGDEFVDTVTVTVIKELDHHELQGEDMTLLSGTKRKMMTRAFYKDGTDELRSDITLKFVNPNAASSENNDNELTAKEGETDVIGVLNGVESSNKKKLTVLGKVSGPVTGLEIEPASSPTSRVKVASGKSIQYKVFEMHGTARGDEVAQSLVPKEVTMTQNSSIAPGLFTAGDMGEAEIKVSEGSLSATLYIEITDAVKSVILNGGRDIELALGETKEIAGTIELGSSAPSNDLSTLTFNPALPGNENVELALSADKTKLTVKGLRAGEYTLTGSIDGVVGSIKIKVKAKAKVVRVLDADGQPFVKDMISMKLGFPGVSPTAKLVSVVDLKGTEDLKDVTSVANWALNASDGSSTLTNGKPPLEALKGGTGTLIVTAEGVSSVPMTVKVEVPTDLIVLDGSGNAFPNNTMNLSVNGPEVDYTLYLTGYADGSRLLATDLGKGSPSEELPVTIPEKGKVKPSATASGSGTIMWSAMLAQWGNYFTKPLNVVVEAQHVRFEVEPSSLSLTTGGPAGSYKVFDVLNTGLRFDVTTGYNGTKAITSAVPANADPFSIVTNGSTRSIQPAADASGSGTLTFGEGDPTPAVLTITVSPAHVRYEVEPTSLSLTTGGASGSYKVFDVKNDGTRPEVTATLDGIKVITTAVPTGSDPFSSAVRGTVAPAANASGGGTLTFGEATITITVTKAPTGLIARSSDDLEFFQNSINGAYVGGEDVPYKLYLAYNDGTRDPRTNDLDGTVLSGPASFSARGMIRPSSNTTGIATVSWTTTESGGQQFSLTMTVGVDVPPMTGNGDGVVRFLKPTIGGNNATVSNADPAKNQAPDAIVTELSTGRTWYMKKIVFPGHSMTVFVAADQIGGDKSVPFFFYQVPASNRVNLNYGGNFPGSWASISGSTYFASNANGESDIVLEFDLQTLAVAKGNR